MVDAVGIIGSSSSSAAGNASKQLDSDFDDFLKLFITQLENQDPTEPLDSNQFTQQIVSFTQVEQQIATNTNLEKIVTAQNAAQTSDLVAYVGKEVEFEGSTISVPAEGNTLFAFELEEAVDEAFVTIRDTSGNVVFNGTAPTTAGRQTVSWDGLDNNGNRVSEGVYFVQVTSETGDVLDEHQPIVKGTVSGINMLSEDPGLVVNFQEVKLSDIRFVGTEPQ